MRPARFAVRTAGRDRRFMDRMQQIREWVSACYPGQVPSIAVASTDASFRRYFRVNHAAGTAIVMDAPPEREDVAPWLAVRERLAAAGVRVPQLYAAAPEHGLLLIGDLGLSHLADLLDVASAPELYRTAVDTLIAIQTGADASALAPYDAAFLRSELDLFPAWYLTRHLGIELTQTERARLDEVFARLLAKHLAEPTVFVHRDFHSRNLLRPDGVAEFAVIDFQGALRGPLSYDLVSLLRDAYVSWDEEFVIDQAVRYWERARRAGLPVRADFADFYCDFEWMGVQRHLKILGIFARLHHRDGKDGYLQHMPRVIAYLRTACSRYAALGLIARLLDRAENRQAQTGYTF